MISKQSLDFLSDLKKNNNRDWFLANKARYETYKLEYQKLTSEFIAAVSEKDASVAHLQPKDCMFRINRDIRFSNDKTPYKTNMAIWICEGQKNTNLSGYYVHIEPGASFIAGGVYWPDAADLKKIRKEIAFFHDELEAVLESKEFKKEFKALERNENNSLKTAPKGYEKDHPAIELLKLKCFTASHKLTDAELKDPDFVKKTSARLLPLKPLNEFLNRALQAPDA